MWLGVPHQQGHTLHTTPGFLFNPHTLPYGGFLWLHTPPAPLTLEPVGCAAPKAVTYWPQEVCQSDLHVFRQVY